VGYNQGMDSSETTNEARKIARANSASRASRVVAIAFAVCLIYGLSIGPAVWVITLMGLEDSEATYRVYYVFYAPVIYLVEYTPLKGPIDGYVDWWLEMSRRIK
jgi:hypothetical protein